MEGIRLKGMMEKFTNKVERMAAMVDDKTLISQLIREHSPRIDLIEFKDARADIWQHFRLVQLDGQTLAYAVCIRCLKPVSYKAREGTGGLHRHPCSKAAAANAVSLTTLGALAYFNSNKNAVAAANASVSASNASSSNIRSNDANSGKNGNSASSGNNGSSGSSPPSSLSPSSSPPVNVLASSVSMSSSMSSSSSSSSSSSGRNGHNHLHHSLSYPIQNSPLSLTTTNKSSSGGSGATGSNSRKGSSCNTAVALYQEGSPDGSSSHSSSSHSSSSAINNSLNNLSSIMTNSFGIKGNGSERMTSPNQHLHQHNNHNSLSSNTFTFNYANGSLKSDCHAMILLNDANCPPCHPVTEPMTDLFERQVLLDLTLVAKNGRIKVHKLALAAASPVFEESLNSSQRNEQFSSESVDDNTDDSDDNHEQGITNDFPEDMSSGNNKSTKQEGQGEEVMDSEQESSSRRKRVTQNRCNSVTELDMSDFDVSSVQALVEFVYYGELNDSELVMTEVMKMSEVYEMKALKFACAQRLYRSLTPENAIEYLALAESCNCEQLKQLIPCFIAENAARVTSTDAWKETFKDRSDLVANLLAVTATDLSMNGSNGNKKRKTSF